MPSAKNADRCLKAAKEGEQKVGGIVETGKKGGLAMGKCHQCKWFFPVPEGEADYEPGKGDCVKECQDNKGKWWSMKVVFEHGECSDFMQKTSN